MGEKEEKKIEKQRIKERLPTSQLEWQKIETLCEEVQKMIISTNLESYLRILNNND